MSPTSYPVNGHSWNRTINGTTNFFGARAVAVILTANGVGYSHNFSGPLRLVAPVVTAFDGFIKFLSQSVALLDDKTKLISSITAHLCKNQVPLALRLLGLV
jgi:hypothetical protein